MAENDNPGPHQLRWRLRQIAVYQGVRPTVNDANTQNPPAGQQPLKSTIIVIRTPEEMKTQLCDYVNKVVLKDDAWAESFGFHLLILHELMGTWRPYLRWLTAEITKGVCPRSTPIIFKCNITLHRLPQGFSAAPDAREKVSTPGS